MASAVAAVALLTGCSTENDIENGKDGLASLELSSVSSSDILTRAVIDGVEFPTDKGNIGLFLYADKDASEKYGDVYENVQYTYNSTKSKWTASPSIKVGSKSGYLYGYYPYNAANTDVKAIPVTSSVNGDDVMYASKQEQPITNLTAANTSIKMNHALARVAIKVINNGYTGEAKLSRIKFEDATIASSGTLNAIDGSITASKADDVALSVLAAEQTIATGDGSTYECLLVPSEINNERQDVWLYLTIDGQEKNLKLSGNNGVIFKPGVKSTVTITLSNTGIALKSVSINDWQTVKVGEHTVTVKFADDVTPPDVLTGAYVDGDAVKILALSLLSLSKKRLECTLSGTAEVSRIISDNTFTFTISNISSDVTATIGYEKTLTVTALSNDPSWGSASYEGEPFIDEMITFTATANDGIKFIEWQDADGNTLSKDNPYSVTLTSDLTVTAVFMRSDFLLGAFTVAVDGQGKPKKVVRFSKGNLWYGPKTTGATATFNFEEYQYDTNPTSGGKRVENHISHFMWCNSAENAIKLEYDKSWGEQTSFFAASGFTVNGFSNWSTLSQAEWTYLLSSRNTAYRSDHRYAVVKVNDMAGLLIFPDNFSAWPSGAGDEPQTFNQGSSNWNDRNYSVDQFNVLQDNGCVFLPAAGYRSGDTGSSNKDLVYSVGNYGYYVSSSYFVAGGDPILLRFHYDEVKTDKIGNSNLAYSVRLVTEVK